MMRDSTTPAAALPSPPAPAPDFSLERDAFGQLVLLDAGGAAVVVPVRAFPLGAPDECISLVAAQGRERAWIERLADLPAAQQDLLQAELALREFMPTIEQLVAVSTFSTPSVWDVATDRGPARLVLQSEDDLRRLGEAGLLVTSADGVAFRIPDRFALDRGSRRLLDRFL